VLKGKNNKARACMKRGIKIKYFLYEICLDLKLIELKRLLLMAKEKAAPEDIVMEIIYILESSN
jgi:hypothetical protein